MNSIRFENFWYHISEFNKAVKNGEFNKIKNERPPQKDRLVNNRKNVQDLINKGISYCNKKLFEESLKYLRLRKEFLLN